MGGQTFELNPAKWIYSPCWGGVLFWHRDQDVVQHETKPYMSRVLLSGWSPGSQAINRLCTQCSCSIPFTHPYLWVCFLRLCACVCVRLIHRAVKCRRGSVYSCCCVPGSVTVPSPSHTSCTTRRTSPSYPPSINQVAQHHCSIVLPFTLMAGISTISLLVQSVV